MFLSLCFGFGSVAWANTNLIVAKGNTKGTVLIIGSPSDHEAYRFFETLTAPVQDFNGKWSKVFLFDNAAGERILSASCVFSKILKENGTCTVTIFPVSGGMVDGGRGVVEYISPDSSEAARMAEGYTAPDANGLIYANDNGRFRIDAQVLKGVIQSVTLTYK
jgi:hypothetical protein